MIKNIISVAVSLSVAAPVLTMAQVPLPGVGERLRNAAQEVNQELRDARQNVQQEIRGARQGVRAEVQERRAGVAEQIKAKREEAKALIEKKRGDFKAAVEAKRAELKVRVQAKREELKERLAKIKDERKKQIVERVDQRLDALNENRMTHFSNVLERLEKILDNIDSRAAKAEANGRDVAAVRAAHDAAKNAINNVRAMIEAQSGKTYVIAVSNETGLRQDVGKARQALHADLTKVQQAVQAARDAVHKAAVALAQIPRVDELEVEETAAPETATTTQSQ